MRATDVYVRFMLSHSQNEYGVEVQKETERHEPSTVEPKGILYRFIISIYV